MNKQEPRSPRQDDDTNEGFEALWRTYYERLVHYARGRLGTMPRRDADEEDVALSAMNSFYRGWSDGRFANLNDPDDLWKMLLTITARKANKRIRYQQAEKRGAGTVRGESVFDRDAAFGNNDRGIDQIIATAPTHSPVTIFGR